MKIISMDCWTLVRGHLWGWLGTGIFWLIIAWSMMARGEPPWFAVVHKTLLAACRERLLIEEYGRFKQVEGRKDASIHEVLLTM